MNKTEALRIANLFKEKKAKGEVLSKGEEVILTLLTELDTIVNQNYKISNELCVDIISLHKKRMGESGKTSTYMDDMELNMLLEGLLERLYFH